MRNSGFHRRYEKETLDEAQQAALNWFPRYEWLHTGLHTGPLTDAAIQAITERARYSPPQTVQEVCQLRLCALSRETRERRENVV